MDKPPSHATRPSPSGNDFASGLRAARRHRRCSQLDLALTAGVSQRHLSFLESGRARPSRAMLLQIAEALDLSLQRRNQLLVAAGFAPVYPRRALGTADMVPVMSALTRMLTHHEPFPALVMDRQWNLLLANGAAERMIGLIGKPETVWSTVCPDGVPNIVRLTLHPQGLRPFIVNLDEVGPALISRLRQEAPDHPPIAELLETVLAYPGIPRRWHRAELSAAPAPVLATHLRAGTIDLKLFTMLSTFGTPQDQTADEIRVETLYPSDEASERLLRALAGETG